MIIKDILVSGLKTIPHSASMLEAQKMMREHGFRHLPVSDGSILVGILSDRDVKLASVITADDTKKEGYIHAHKLVSEFMTSPVLKARTTDPVEKVVRDMIQLKVSAFVIVDESGRDIGIVTTEDLLIVFLDVLDSKKSLFTKLLSTFNRG